MRSNFHTHTQRCKHAYGDERDYVEFAVKNELDILGFSDHGPFPDHDFGLRMDYDELPDYLSAIDSLSAEYKDKIRLYKGLEIEFHPKYITYYKQLSDLFHLDYLALGEHMFTDSNRKVKNIYFAESTDDYIEYAENIAAGAETGCFAFIAHPDLMFMNKFEWDKNCDKACDMILSAAEKYNIILEFNANGIRRGRQYFPDGMRLAYPDERFWKMLRGSRQPVIIGADCHVPEQIRDSAIGIAEKMCMELDLNVVDTIF